MTDHELSEPSPLDRASHLALLHATASEVVRRIDARMVELNRAADIAHQLRHLAAEATDMAGPELAAALDGIEVMRLVLRQLSERTISVELSDLRHHLRHAKRGLPDAADWIEPGLPFGP